VLDEVAQGHVSLTVLPQMLHIQPQ